MLADSNITLTQRLDTLECILLDIAFKQTDQHEITRDELKAKLKQYKVVEE